MTKVYHLSDIQIIVAIYVFQAGKRVFLFQKYQEHNGNHKFCQSAFPHSSYHRIHRQQQEQKEQKRFLKTETNQFKKFLLCFFVSVFNTGISFCRTAASDLYTVIEINSETHENFHIQNTAHEPKASAHKRVTYNVATLLLYTLKMMTAVLM